MIPMFRAGPIDAGPGVRPCGEALHEMSMRVRVVAGALLLSAVLLPVLAMPRGPTRS
jgi:hypothetical protein